ncbi:N-acetylglucosamine kinase [Streptomyces buecherae]|uniref:ATPase n=1 Tax=Streptomyces buecherae TaxID=2763006 RepID=A0A7H8N2A1_9ACTN|nr:BadF/BadG/BcrA/BcrD ATPase family protein [Streptomyces buecherae]QKW48565.1 ATPase [Streptomyces buecherae]
MSAPDPQPDPAAGHAPEPGPRAPAVHYALGVDSGGSGVRIALGPVGPRGAPAAEPLTWHSPTPALVGKRGIDAAGLLGQVLPAAQRLLRQVGAERVAAVCVGAAGMASLGDDLRAHLPTALADALGPRRLALAADGVTAYVGALGQRPGAVVAAGTGMIALGTGPGTGPGDKRHGGWRRVDGWGHLLGDCGGGAWVGRAGLEAAMRAHDGRAGGSQPLLSRLEATFGPPEHLPGLLYPRSDRPAVLASFAPEVGRCAATDPVAAAILREAADHIARAAQAAFPHPPTTGQAAHGDDVGALALTGGLFRMGAPLVGPVRRELARRLPGVPVTEAAGDPLAGALRVASALAADALRLPVDGELLQVL